MNNNKQYRIVLSHRHLTKKFDRMARHFNGIAPAFSETVIWTITADIDLLTHESMGEVLALLKQKIPQEDGWGPWTVELISDAYEFAKPPALAFAPDSPAGLTLAYAMARYPRVFGVNEFSPYRVLEHWFCTIGNGYTWSPDGELVSDFRITPELLRQAQERRLSAEMQEDIEEVLAETTLFGDDPHPCAPVSVYPLSSTYSKLFTLPENVEDSYLVAFYQFVCFMLSRPLWENFSHAPQDLVEEGDVYETDAWRHLMLAEGARIRCLVEVAFENAMAHPVIGPRLRKVAGFDGSAFPHADYRLPPRVREVHLRLDEDFSASM